jgi:hypothetical protein
MKNSHTQQNSNTATVYHIRVKGVLDHNWSDWFDGLVISALPNGETRLTGPVVDQAALYGVLHKIRDIGLPLLSLCQVGGDEP